MDIQHAKVKWIVRKKGSTLQRDVKKQETSSSSESTSTSEASSGSETSSSAESPSDTDYEVTSDSLDTEPSTVSSPEAVKDKHSKHKTVRKLKHKMKKAKVEYDSSEDESSDIPKKKRKVKNLERVLNLRNIRKERKAKVKEENISILQFMNINNMLNLNP